MKALATTIACTFFCFNAFAQQPELILPVGHAGEIYTAEFSLNKKFLLTISTEGAVNIWEAATGRLMNSILPENGQISAAHFSPDGAFLATGGTDSLLRLWETKNSRLIWTAKNRSRVQNLHFSPDGKKIGVVCHYAPLVVWETATGKNPKEYRYHSPLQVIEFQEDNQTIKASYLNGDIVDFDLATGAFLKSRNVADANTGIPHSSPDGRYLVTTETAFPTKVWDRSGKLLYVKPSYQDISFSPDSKYFVSSTCTSGDSIPTVYELATGRVICKLSGTTGIATEAVFSPDGNYIATSSMFGAARLWHAMSGKLVSLLNGDTGEYNVVSFSKDSRLLVTTSEDGKAYLWDIPTGKMVNTIKGENEITEGAVFSKDGTVFASWSGSAIELWDLCSAKIIRTMKEDSLDIESVSFHPVNGHLLSVLPDGSFSTWDPATGNRLSHFKSRTGSEHIMITRVTADGNSIIHVTKAGIMITDILTGVSGRKFSTGPRPVYSIDISNDKKYLLSTTADSMCKVWSTATGSLVATKKTKHNQSRAWFDQSGENIIIDNFVDTDQTFWHFSGSGTSEAMKGHTWFLSEFHVSPSGKYFITASNDYTAILWDAHTLQPLFRLPHENFLARDAVLSPDEKYIFSYAEDKMTRVWNSSTGTLLAKLPGRLFDINKDSRYFILDNTTMNIYSMLVGPDGTPRINFLYKALTLHDDDYLVMLPDNLYYKSIRNSLKTLSFKLNDRLFSFDQFDLQYNRPDKVLQAIGSADTALITAYHSAWQKRIERSNIDTSLFADEHHVPETVITNMEQVEGTTGNNKVNLDIHLSETDKASYLDKLYISINDIPLLGSYGKDISGGRLSDTSFRFPALLSEGENHIKVSCRNSRSAESLRQSLYIRYQPDPGNSVKPQTYFIGIGVNHYINDSTRNLSFAAKDILDLDKLFKSGDPSTISTILIDSRVTKKNILAIKSMLNKTKIDDKVIIALSGHGLRYLQKDFYFGTYDIDFDRPYERGLKYEDLESLLDDIPARKKLLLIDACHSGEVDTSANPNSLDLTNVAPETKEPAGMSDSVKTKGDPNRHSRSSVGLDNSLDLMKELFADLSRGNGTVVISAARGRGYAEENPLWSNGAFTLCLKAAFSGNPRFPQLKEKADKNGDGVSINELKNYILTKVPLLTNGRQKPTTRRENVEVDWKLW